MTTTGRLRRFGLLAALAVGLVACGGGGGGPTENAPAAGGGGTAANIVIKNFVYSPIPAQAMVGQAITVTNEDSAVHTLTVPDGVDSGNLAQGKSFTFTPTEAGELDYLCDIHQYMKGKIIVR